jgi:hypothetical protein
MIDLLGLWEFDGLWSEELQTAVRSDKQMTIAQKNWQMRTTRTAGLRKT